MSLATRCPHCNTLFKVTSGQLQLHQGQVRCGHCQQVFSGIDHLTAADSDAWQNLKLPQRKPDTAAASTPKTGDFLSTPEAKTPRWRQDLANASPLMRLGSLALLTCLVLQALWWKRVDIVLALGAPTFATSGPWLQSLFALPATQGLALDGSGLQALDENTLRIDLTLRNTQSLPARWPHLKIELLDSQGLLLATKSLSPPDYQENLAAPIAAGKTVEVLAYLNLKKLYEQLPESAVTGFRLALYDTSLQQP